MAKGEQTRERIFQAASQVSAKHGYEGAKIARITKLTQVNTEQVVIEIFQPIFVEDRNLFQAITQDEEAEKLF